MGQPYDFNSNYFGNFVGFGFFCRYLEAAGEDCPMNKRGMEMWQLIIMLLAIFLLLFMLVWYGILGQGLADILQKIGGLF